jgi:NAD(P)-dependent dehydrogenase (short-subunit alcohol dehydrogenase family)
VEELMPTVLITGASRGFGQALLDVYLKNKWTTFPIIRNQKSISNVLSLYSMQCYPIVGDITSEATGLEIDRTLRNNTDSLDVLINNAGNIKKNRGIEKISPVDLKEHFDIHCVGAFRCVKAALPFLKNSPRPLIINITSRWGSIGSTASGKGNTIYGYNIAKAAQNTLTACLFQDLKRLNIKVLAVHPGKLLTSVAAPDADTLPEVAAQKLFDWINQVDNSFECKCYDLVNETTIEC